jgi:hypothetical protein
MLMLSFVAECSLRLFPSSKCRSDYKTVVDYLIKRLLLTLIASTAVLMEPGVLVWMITVSADREMTYIHMTPWWRHRHIMRHQSEIRFLSSVFSQKHGSNLKYFKCHDLHVGTGTTHNGSEI